MRQNPMAEQQKNRVEEEDQSNRNNIYVLGPPGKKNINIGLLKHSFVKVQNETTNK